MIGKWNKSVILTYIGVIFATYGIIIANININYAIIALAIAGICDLLDGAIARMCKRTEEEKAFGIQLDSLADVVSFGILPITIIINLMGLTWVNFIGCGTYVIFGIARLAYFNILVEKDKNTPIKFYHGLPITYIALTLPITYVIALYALPQYVWIISYAALLFTSILFIVDIPIKKPSSKTYPFFIILALIVIIALGAKIS